MLIYKRTQINKGNDKMKKNCGIGERIKLKREEKKWTQEELARRMGYSTKSTIAKIETGVNDVSASNVEKFANILETSIAYLMGWEDEELKEPPLIPEAPLSERIGKKISYIRHKRNLSIEELAEKTGVTPSQLEDMENGVNRGFNPELMKRFCEVLNVDDTYFLDMIEPVKNIGENITALRHMNDLSLNELAEELHVSTDKLSDYENGVEQIPYDTLDRLASLFNVSVNMLIGMNFKARENETRFVSIMRILKRTRQWNEVVGETQFSDEEMNQLMDYAKYIISKRKVE